MASYSDKLIALVDKWREGRPREDSGIKQECIALREEYRKLLQDTYRATHKKEMPASEIAEHERIPREPSEDPSVYLERVRDFFKTKIAEHTQQRKG